MRDVPACERHRFRSEHEARRREWVLDQLDEAARWVHLGRTGHADLAVVAIELAHLARALERQLMFELREPPRISAA